MNDRVLKRGVTHYLTIECTVDASVNVGMVQDMIRTEPMAAKKTSSLLTDDKPQKSTQELMMEKYAK